MKKQLQKCLILAVALTTTISQSVSAVVLDSTSGLNGSTQVVTVSGTADCGLADRPISIYAIAADNSKVYAGQILTKENGRFETKFKIPEGTASGNVSIKVRGYQEAASASLPAFWYASPLELESLTLGLNNGTLSLADILANPQNSDFINLNINLSVWDSSLAPKVATLLEGVTYSDAGDIKENVYKAAVVALVSEKTSQDAVGFLKENDDGGTHLSMLKLDSAAEELFLSDDAIALFAVENANKNAAKASTFVEDFEKKIAVGAVNTADNWREFQSLLSKHKSLMDLNEEQIAMVTDYESNESLAALVCKEMVKKLPLVSVEDLLEKFELAVENAEEAIEDAKKKPTSGGSSGGGRGNVIAMPGNTTNNNTSANAENKPKYVYNDVTEEHWAYNSIMAMTQSGIVGGMGDGSFKPDRAVTREEFVKMLVLATGVDTTAEIKLAYTDVKFGDWFYPYVSAAYKSGLVLGADAARFGTGEIINREQMATICYRAVKLNNTKLNMVEKESFSDEGDISDYAKEAVQTLYSAQLLNGVGDNLFMPKGTVTRAQAVHMIFNIYRKDGK